MSTRLLKYAAAVSAAGVGSLLLWTFLFRDPPRPPALPAPPPDVLVAAPTLEYAVVSLRADGEDALGQTLTGRPHEPMRLALRVKPADPLFLRRSGEIQVTSVSRSDPESVSGVIMESASVTLPPTSDDAWSVEVPFHFPRAAYEWGCDLIVKPISYAPAVGPDQRVATLLVEGEPFPDPSENWSDADREAGFVDDSR